MVSDRYAEYVYPAFRFVFGFLFLFHALAKLGLLGGAMVPLMSRLGAATLIELVCGPLVAVGFFTRAAALLASGEMVFAYFLSHHPRGGWPIQNQGETAVLYCFAFLYIAARGAGRFGLDRR